ncbi:MAG: helix-turn-helix domain-containing protein [Ignavibacteriae bacterium]|nr:helix-turn-helix domain-containing protein [Ignavibacteriota bacterium]
MSSFIKYKKLLNQAEIARQIGISKSYLNQIILGTKKSEKYEKEIEKIIKELAMKQSTK